MYCLTGAIRGPYGFCRPRPEHFDCAQRKDMGDPHLNHFHRRSESTRIWVVCSRGFAPQVIV